jgi:hypothetical protein
MPGHRTVAKHSYLTGKDKGVARAKAHINYIQFRAGKENEKEERSFFNGLRDDIYNKELKDAISDQNPRGTVMHKLILSPGVEGADVKEYAREVMADLGSKKGLDLEWYAVEHNNTDNPHCHIVVMGKDENGRNVRIYKKDYEVIKEAGDKYLERNRLLDREEKDKERDERDKTSDEKNTVNRFFDALKAAAKEFSKAMGKDNKEVRGDETDYQKRKREKNEEKQKERSLLGDDLDYDAKLLNQQKSEERQQVEKEQRWKEYCKPIEAQYRLPDGQELSFAFDRSNSLEILKDLKDSKGGLKKDDHERLKAWINEKERDTARVDAKAEKLEEIDISLDSEHEIKWSKDSSLEDLKKLEELNNRREVFLDEVETKALDKWISAKDPERAKDKDAIEHSYGVFSKQTSLEELKEFRQSLYESNERISPDKYAKLSTWIETKEKHGEDAFKKAEPQKESKLEIRDEYWDDGKKVHTPRRKLSALEKRMERAMRQEKAERLKNYYAEKALQRERLEKSKEEARTDIKWERVSAGKPVMQFVNLLRKGARELEKQRQNDKGKELEKLKPEDKDTKDKTEKSERKKVVLPYPEPKSHLEELANKRALDLEEKNRTKTDLEKEQQLRQEQKEGKIQDKPKEKPNKDNKNKDEKAESKTKSKEEKDKDDEERGGR